MLELQKELDRKSGLDLESLSAFELKQMIKIQKEGLQRLKLKLEKVRGYHGWQAKMEEVQEELSKCVICFVNSKEMIVVPCGHKVIVEKDDSDEY